MLCLQLWRWVLHTSRLDESLHESCSYRRHIGTGVMSAGNSKCTPHPQASYESRAGRQLSSPCSLPIWALTEKGTHLRRYGDEPCFLDSGLSRGPYSDLFLRPPASTGETAEGDEGEHHTRAHQALDSIIKGPVSPAQSFSLFSSSQHHLSFNNQTTLPTHS